MTIFRTSFIIFMLLISSNYSSAQIIGNNYCPIDPSNINYQALKDSVDVFSSKWIKIIDDHPEFYKGKILHVRLEYAYCDSTSKYEIRQMQEASEMMMIDIKEFFSKYEKVGFEIISGIVNPAFISINKTCMDYLGIRLSVTAGIP
jgi:hypothetical protein